MVYLHYKRIEEDKKGVTKIRFWQQLKENLHYTLQKDKIMTIHICYKPTSHHKKRYHIAYHTGTVAEAMEHAKQQVYALFPNAVLYMCESFTN